MIVMLSVFFLTLVDHLGVFGRMSFQILTLFSFIFKAFKNFGCLALCCGVWVSLVAFGSGRKGPN